MVSTARIRYGALLLIGILFALTVGVIGSDRADAAAPADTWTANPASPDTVAWQGVAWSPTAQVFVAVGTNNAMTSPNGVTWTTQTAPTGGWSAVTWSPALGQFAAVATNGTNRVMTSPDGITWTPRVVTGGAGAWSTIIWAPELHEFIGTAVGAAVMSSPDGVTWSALTGGARPALTHALAWSATLARLVAVSGPTGTATWTSPDGTTWTAGSSLPAGAWRGVAWSPTANLFVAVGATTGAGANNVATSADGINWTPAPTPVTAALNGIVWSPEQAEFVAVGAGTVMSSPDGVTWITITDPAPANNWTSIVWSATLTRYVATSSNGTSRTMVGVVPTAAPPATPPSTPQLPTTGVDVAPLVIWSSLAFALGAVALIVSRRRRAS